jgi:hypothetical protein
MDSDFILKFEACHFVGVKTDELKAVKKIETP